MPGMSPNSESGRRKWKRLVLIPVLLAPLVGFLISYAFPPKYTAQSLVLVEGQRVPDSYVKSVITSDFTQRVATLQTQVMSPNRLRPMIESMGITKPEEQTKLISDIQANMSLQPVVTGMAADAGLATQDAKSSQNTEVLPGFDVIYADSDPRRAQQITDGVTSLLLTENMASRADIAKDTVQFLEGQKGKARTNLLELSRQIIEHAQNASPRNSANEALQKVLVLEYDTAQKDYAELLTKLSMAKTAEDMEIQAMGEQFRILNPANLPESPDFPRRRQFAFGGLLTGLALGIGLVLWNRFRPTTSAAGESVADTPATSAAPRRSFFRRAPVE